MDQARRSWEYKAKKRSVRVKRSENGRKRMKKKILSLMLMVFLQHPLRHAVRTAGKTATVQICRKQRRKFLPARQGRKRRPWFTVLLDYTRINPAMDEHGEINLLLFNGLTAHDADDNIVRVWQKMGVRCRNLHLHLSYPGWHPMA